MRITVSYRDGDCALKLIIIILFFKYINLQYHC